MKYKIAIKDKKFEVEVGEFRDGLAQVFVNGESYEVVVENYAELVPGGAISQTQAAPAPVTTPTAPKPVTPKPAPTAAPAAPKPAPQAAAPAPKPEPPAAPVAPSVTPAGGGTVVAPIPGLILDVKVKVGDQVLAGETVAVMEAMKMENNVVSDVSGTVKEVMVQKGAEVSTGDVLMTIG
jgi:biotin carboxyl carrier protein